VSAAGSGIPPGYSSEIIQVKFRASADVARPEALMPAKLQGSVRNMRPLFNLPKAKLNNMRGTNLNLWFQITLAPGTDAASFLEELRRAENVEVAEPAPLPQPPPATTPNFTGDQGYLNPATDGIDARFSWTRPGGNASGITLYDVEYSWNQMHEDLSKVNGVALLLNLGDAAVDPFRDTNHGTAVLGELIANNDTRGVTGIAWGATIRLAPANTQVLGYNPANAILLAVADGAAGDVILIEQQTPVCGLQQYGPLEAVTSVFDAIQTAVAHGLVVVEAAGNGAVNLDQAVCGNIFNRSARDSGAIIVGAGGAPGSGTDRQRLAFSSYGGRVDLQGWGGGVATSGYGSLYVNVDDPTNPNFWYTDGFSGTSSASPMIAGSAADLQGMARQQSGAPLNPPQARQILVATGSPQLGDTSQHIGPRPNLQAASSNLMAICQQGCISDDATCEDNCIADLESCPIETPHANCVKVFKACWKGCRIGLAQCLAKCQ
jgi:hypothetical protein